MGKNNLTIGWLVVDWKNYGGIIQRLHSEVDFAREINIEPSHKVKIFQRCFVKQSFEEKSTAGTSLANKKYTPKTNMEPENGPLEKEIPIGNHPFQVPC